MSSERRLAARNMRLAMSSERRIAAHDVRHLCGGVSDMTIWRWLNNPEMEFPRPIYIGTRRYWKEADVIDWLECRETESA